nr:hypothetical protein BaRGS_010805 [Batillaria attramentaria]
MACNKIFGLVATTASYIPSVSTNDVMRTLTELFYFDSYVHSDPAIEVIDDKFEGVPVKIFRPKAARSSSPAIVYLHGGGWTLLSANSYSTVTAHMARSYNVIVVSVDYRLAPENPYPIPFDDCLKATRHVLQNGQNYGINTKRVALAGDSAGGNLAAAVALRLTSEDASETPRLKFQILIYPALQAFDFNTYSYQTYARTGVLSKDTIVALWMNYMGFPELAARLPDFAASNHTSPLLKKSTYASYVKHENLPKEVRSSSFQPVSNNVGNEAISRKIEVTLLDPYFAPLLAPDVSKMPPTYLIVAENDPLRDDGLLYAERLKKAGVPTQDDFQPEAEQQNGNAG